MCGNSNVAEKWISGHYAMGQNKKRTNGRIQKPLHSCWKKKLAFSVSPIDDYVKHIFREHNQEADYLANLGAGRKKITQNWKAVRGFWDGSTKTDGRSGRGVVIKGVDWDKWITISKIAVPLKACTATAPEAVGVSVLTGILDLALGRNLSVEAIKQGIDAVIKLL